jgi:hypothetical protein
MGFVSKPLHSVITYESVVNCLAFNPFNEWVLATGSPLEPLEADFLELNDLTCKMDPKTSGLGSFDEPNEFFDDFLFYYNRFSAFQDNDCYIKIEEMEDFPRRLMRN